MRTTFITSLLAATLSSKVVLAQYLNQTAPFYLVLLSSNNTLNGSTLSSCHEGAAIESLCVGSAFSPTLNPAQYNLNYTASAAVDPNLPGTTGVLTWVLQGANFNLSSPLQFSYNAASNVAVPMFLPSITLTQAVGFDEDDKLFVAANGWDDSVSPGAYNDRPLYRWVACTTNVGYTYQTLAWVLGNGVAQNPTCEEVDVKRIFV